MVVSLLAAACAVESSVWLCTGALAITKVRGLCDLKT